LAGFDFTTGEDEAEDGKGEDMGGNEGEDATKSIVRTDFSEPAIIPLRYRCRW
jgi:hypothetical protein